MKKIYYLQKHEVKLGDVIEYAGIRTILTEELIGLNPELFIVKDPMQELLDEAKRRYPIGTVYKHFNSEHTTNSPDMLTVSEMDHHFAFGTCIWVRSEEYNGIVYEDGEWAEILPLKFTTEDGVGIYGDMKTYLVNPKDINDICLLHSTWEGNLVGSDYKYFYYKENALAYIEKHKEKTLNDYENSLGLSVWNWFKPHELKLYYTKILQLIADDLNDGRYIHERGQVSFHINKEGGVNLHMGGDEGCVYFKSNELAQRAINILGDKLECLFNQA